MTRQEALQIPDLCIKVTPLIEDFFYSMLEGKGEIKHSGANDRIKTLAEDYTNGKVKELPPFMQAVDAAKQMYDNLQRYGVACADWCPE